MSTLPTIFVSHGAPTYAKDPSLAGAQLLAAGGMAVRLDGERGLDHGAFGCP